MGKIVISENVSLDGVIQDATGEEGLRSGGWFNRTTAEDRAAWAEVELAEARDAEALLLGAGTYRYFLARGWPTRGGEWADRLRSLPKYVVSSTLDRLDWDNSTVLAGDVADRVSELRHDVAGDIVVYGSGRLVHTLLEGDLVDELRLIIYPVVAGGGGRLFGETQEQKPLRLVENRPVGSGLVRLTYQLSRNG